MKWFYFFSWIFLCSLVIFPQSWNDAKLLKSFSLSDEDIQKIKQFNREANKEVKKAQLELDIIEAQLRRLLADEDANLKQVEKLLRSASEFNIQEKMAKIKREVQIKKLIGSEKWGLIVNAMERMKTKKRQEKLLQELQEKKKQANAKKRKQQNQEKKQKN